VSYYDDTRSRSLIIVSRFNTVTNVTYRWTDRIAVAYTAKVATQCVARQNSSSTHF